MQPPGHAGQRNPFDLGEALGQPARNLGIAAGIERQGDAHDLLAHCAVQIVHRLVETRDQIGLGDDEIDRQAQAKGTLQFLQSAADALHQIVAPVLLVIEKLFGADRHEHAVDRLARAIAAQQIEKAAPGRGIGGAVAVLAGEAAGGVEQHGILGEPPVAVAGATNTLDGICAHLLSDREFQPGIAQQRGLASAGRSDQHIPGHGINIAGASAAHGLHRAFEFFSQRGIVVWQPVAGKGHEILAVQQPFEDTLVGLPRPPIGDDIPNQPQHEKADSNPDAGFFGGKGCPAIELYPRPKEPYDQRRDRQTEEREEAARR